ncbi:MAG TPA: DUF362 domain-containing protein [Pirellulales bacterium]|nr:DUF362 domain-containing protein [Pirellulales bacterium]
MTSATAFESETDQHCSQLFVEYATKADYNDTQPEVFPELPEVPQTTALKLMRRLLASSGLDREHYSTPQWNPLAKLVPADTRVVIKPNWVLHENLAGHGMECLVTHTSVLEAILHYLAKARPRSVVVGDAPVQICDFALLSEYLGLQSMIDKFEPAFQRIRIEDFRLVTFLEEGLLRRRESTPRDPSKYVLFDLRAQSELEPISQGHDFRVTMYDPRILQSTHGPGRHQYLVAREVIDADVIINVPKLKTHKKSGLTAALKNMVGINGSKDYLPHHRKGGSKDGGDCYVGSSVFKRCAENLLDQANTSRSMLMHATYSKLAGLARRSGTVFGNDGNLEGSWYGNDTVWRMCLDLQRIIHYGSAEGNLQTAPQRRVISITDAIIAGEGDGPLASSPVALGAMTMGKNVAALEWVHALMMQLDPRKIPLIDRAFDQHHFPLAQFSPNDIVLSLNGSNVKLEHLIQKWSVKVRPAEGWIGHCELAIS